MGGKLGARAVPFLGTALLAAQGVAQTISTVNAGLKGGKGWQESLKAGAGVAAVSAGMAGASLIPGMGRVAGVGGTFAIDAMANKMKEGLENKPTIVQVNVDGKEGINTQIKTNAELEARDESVIVKATVKE